MTAQKLKVKLIDRNDKIVSWFEVDDLKRKPGAPYERRSVIHMGIKYAEPEAAALEYAPADEWHEVTA